MLRFPNPGSTIENLLHIYKVLYKELNNQPFFDLDDISKTMTDALLAASSGYVGEEALERSTRDDRSLDPLYNQSKMYAEIFRSLGWVSSTGESALHFVFTLLGEYAGESNDIDPIFEESILGIVYPNDILDAKSEISSRPFLSILKTLDKLGGYLYRDEMILGPMSYDDDSNELLEKINEILLARPDFAKLKKMLSEASEALGIQENTMQNYTRFPISVLEYCGWIEKENNKTIYSKNIKLMKLTEKGQQLVSDLDLYHDERMALFEKRKEKLKKAMANLGFYQMLDRSGYDIESVLDSLKKYTDELNAEGVEKNVLFSPYQTLKKEEVDSLLDVKTEKNSIEHKDNHDIEHKGNLEKNVEIADVHIVSGYGTSFTKNDFVNEILELSQSNSFGKIVKTLLIKYKTAKKETFYTLVGHMFSIMGFKCKVSRGGVNYERFDAIVEDDKRSIPIEIKSPTEEEHLSTKGIRQALENKIILLSRKTYKTDPDVSSLVVCYMLPNSRAEVNDLINAIKSVYGIKIGVLDFESLLKITCNIVLNKKSIDKKEIEGLEGLINVKIA